MTNIREDRQSNRNTPDADSRGPARGFGSGSYVGVLAAGLYMAGLLTLFSQPGTYFENFNSGAGGWFLDGGHYQSSGGMDNTGYLQGQRDGFSPNYGEAFSGNAASQCLGNLEAVHGNLIQFSYEGKVIQGPVDVPPTQGFYSAAYSTFWTKIVAPSIVPFESNWAPVSFQINTDWTDQEASANGWHRMFGTTSWYDTLHNVAAQEVFYRLSSSSAGTETFVTGLDNFQMSPSAAVPDSGVPTMLIGALWGIGLCLRQRLVRA